YTVILYGGKLIVDEEDLILSSPTTIEAADGEVIWEIFDEYRLPISLDDMPEDLKTSFVAIEEDRKSTRLNSSHVSISYAVFCSYPRLVLSTLFAYTTLFRSHTLLFCMAGN